MFGIALIMMSLIGAGTVAAGYEWQKHKKKRYERGRNRHSRRFYDDEYLDDYYGYEEPDYDYDPRPPPMSRRNPNDVSLFDTDIEEYGNYAMRARMKKYARHKMNSRFGYQASVWDLEGFIK